VHSFLVSAEFQAKAGHAISLEVTLQEVRRIGNKGGDSAIMFAGRFATEAWAPAVVLRAAALVVAVTA
jgi:hypothetical protein